jgi:glycosyltransferase involved in cell wall biosynthesis
LLKERGHNVLTLQPSSAEIPKRAAAHSLIKGGAPITRVLDDYKADIVHAHNVHPLFGWRALASARDVGARTILHLHNFRLVCAIGIAYREGQPCHRCHGTNTLPGLRLNCRGSRAEALVYAVGLRWQQPRLQDHADELVTVSGATAHRLQQFGLPAARPLPNFVANIAESSNAHEGRHALIAGRLVPEKGFDTAIDAARQAGVPLVVAGDGPDEGRLRTLADGADVRFVGRVAADELAQLRRTAAVTLVPSRWEEPCPYSVLDALADGVPVLASGLGGLPELVGDTVAGDWAGELDRLWRDPGLRRARGEAGLERARKYFSADRYYDELMSIYGRG